MKPLKLIVFNNVIIHIIRIQEFPVVEKVLRSFTKGKVVILQCRDTLLQVKLLHSNVTQVQKVLIVQDYVYYWIIIIDRLMYISL